MDITIDEMTPQDWKAVRAIYLEGIATFETDVPGWEKWDRDHLHDCRFREVGRRERIGQMGGVWRDVILLERRSQVVGR